MQTVLETSESCLQHEGVSGGCFDLNSKKEKSVITNTLFSPNVIYSEVNWEAFQTSATTAMVQQVILSFN